jgi:2-keto-4-pentenoate hydratase
MTELAKLLWSARQSGAVVDADDVVHPQNIEEAYAVQREIAALSGAPSRGFKVGSTSVEAQRLLDRVRADFGAFGTVDILFAS